MKRMRIVLALTCGLVAAMPAPAFDPITSVIGRGVSTALDVRTKAEVAADVEIDAALTKKLVDHKGDEFKDVTLLVFARHGVLAGFAPNEAAKRKAEDLARGDKRLRSLKNDVLVGTAGGSFGANALLDKKIDLKLTATKGVNSVNMRWKVYGGDVFLAGVAKSAAEAKLAESTVRGLEGVKALHSSLRIGKN